MLVRIRVTKTCTWSTSLGFQAESKDTISTQRAGNRVLEKSLRVLGSQEILVIATQSQFLKRTAVSEPCMVGHLSRKMSKLFSLFLRRGGVIICEVTAARRYSVDLVEGGLEIPCMLVSKSKNKKGGDTQNVQDLICALSHYRARIRSSQKSVI